MIPSLLLLALGPWLVDCGFITKIDPTIQYEYVIVGTGAGGAPLGARLASLGHRVLMIDAGDDQGESFQYKVPALNLKATEYEPMTWNYYVDHYSDPTRQAKDTKMTYTTSSGQTYVGRNPPAGAKPRGILYPRAGTLGGCTAHNAMITVYPDEADWNNIATLTGDGSWSADKMKEYFKRIEKNQYFPSSPVGHGYNGWLATSVTSLTFVIQDTKYIGLVLGAGAALGQGLTQIITGVAGLAKVLVRDLNSGFPWRDRREGLFQMPVAVRGGDRSGPRDFMMDVIKAKDSKLDILLTTLVTKVRFDTTKKTPRAIGVDFMQGKSLYSADPRYSPSQQAEASGSVNASKEVILSAGAFNTPQLLKLSGIGPKAELESFGIPVLVDSPGVGTNLQDRYETTVISKASSDFKITSKCKWLETDPDPCLEDWKKSGSNDVRGGYTSPGLALAVLKKSSVSDDGNPDLFISGAPAYFTGYYPDYSINATADAKHWTWVVLKAHTRNRAGTVRLRSTNPRDTPLVNFNYFDTGTTADDAASKDAQALVEGMNFARKAFAKAVPLPSTFKEVWPGDRVKNDREMREWVQNESWGHHASCTCPIGADGDKGAVLDAKFRVRGTDGLRVVDASIFPRIPGYFLVLPVYMISEKAADVIHGGS
ncbi:hypothetical protein RJ55_07704 [Drechmeria coniospora]|nr:hypothetical protein RJ55_07704 [Drechmeria coniospora]